MKLNLSRRPQVSKDATPDDADWPFFAQASAVENKGMVPGLDYPQGVQEPNSYTPQALAGSLSSITDDIRQREASWNNLVNAGQHVCVWQNHHHHTNK